MKREIGCLIGLLVLLLTVGCAAPKARTKLTGIDYESYTRPAGHPGDDYTGSLAGPSILDENAAEPEEQPLSEDEDFTSDEIAAAYGRYTDVTVVAATKRLKLGAQANSKHMALFQQALTAAYKKALRTYHPSGFTYSISSVGAVNPLSEVEVNCVLGEQAANEMGQQTCNLFFNTLNKQYNALLQEAQNHATL